MIALITPTGGRPKQLELCARWMKNQTYKGKVLWVITDDVKPYTSEIIKDDFRKNWIIEKRLPKPVWKVGGKHTQCRNLMEGIQVVKGYDNVNRIFIIEDDDYYAPEYLDVMFNELKRKPAVGQRNTTYYFLGKGACVLPNITHGSLFQTAFCTRLLPAFERVVETGTKKVDIDFWNYLPVSYSQEGLLQPKKQLSLGIKGGAGRTGIGIGHMDLFLPYDGTKLKDWIGKDAKYYE